MLEGSCEKLVVDVWYSVGLSVMCVPHESGFPGKELDLGFQALPRNVNQVHDGVVVLWL